MLPAFGSQSMIDPLRRVVVKRPQQAFRTPEAIQSQWQPLGFLNPPDLQQAIDEHQRLVDVLQVAGAEVLALPEDPRTDLDSLYTHDPGLVTDVGFIAFHMGKPNRQAEGPVMAEVLATWGIPLHGSIEAPATAEGGDLLWLDRKTLLAGRSFRTNAAGIARLRQLLEPQSIEVIELHLAAHRGPEEILHLQSVISLLAQDLAVVYRPLLPVPLVELLAQRGIRCIDIPDPEFATQGCNVLTLRPRQVVLLRGNPGTKALLEQAGCHVTEIDGEAIAFPGSGGPTCLTRPLLRSP